ncbi:MAG: hypothetical protein K9M75_12880 [Phycisphaerae bacterium]|nr:hypothetical protein [Phycisphaerae bacterium]
MFLCGCTTTKPVTFKNGNELLKAAGKIKIGDTRNNVVCHLGWRKDQGLVEESWRSKDDGGGMIHPRIAFWHWQVYPVSLYVGFTDDGQVYRIRYYDDRKTPDGPYTMIGPDLSKHTNTLAAK